MLVMLALTAAFTFAVEIAQTARTGRLKTVILFGKQYPQKYFFFPVPQTMNASAELDEFRVIHKQTHK